jgi:hypothetical protein
MAGQASQDVLAQTVDLFAQRVSEYASGIAQRLGQPMSGQQLSKDQVLQRWNYTPLASTDAADQHYHQLVGQGMPPGQALDQVYPFRKMLLAGPDLKSQVDTANQIAGWNAEATGAPPPEPKFLPPTPMQSPAQQAAPALPGAMPGPQAPPVPMPAQGPPAGPPGAPMPMPPPPPQAPGGTVPPMPPNTQIVAMS